MKFQSTKLLELGSCAFRQFNAKHSHCQYIHGYQLKAKFWFGASELDENNWVVDFGALKELKVILQNQFDHTLCVAGNDPHLNLFKQLNDAGICQLRIMPEGVGIEKTAEWCFNTAASFIKKKYGDRCWVEKVEVFEHDLNSAIVDNIATFAKKTDNNEPVLLEEKDTSTTPSTPVAHEHHTPQPQGARVGNHVTTGSWSNPFAGTSWGS